MSKRNKKGRCNDLEAEQRLMQVLAWIREGNSQREVLALIMEEWDLKDRQARNWWEKATSEVKRWGRHDRDFWKGVVLDALMKAQARAQTVEQYGPAVRGLTEIAKITDIYPRETATADPHVDVVREILYMPSAERQRRLEELRKKKGK